MTPEEFLKDTIDYYSTDINRRCVSSKGGSCVYSPKNAGKVGVSEGCAIGRHLTDETKELFDKYKGENIGCPDILDIFKSDEMRHHLPIWMQKMDKYFLNRVQSLHDRTSSWDGKNGLSTTGKMRVNSIIENYKLKMERYDI